MACVIQSDLFLSTHIVNKLINCYVVVYVSITGRSTESYTEKLRMFLVNIGRVCVSTPRKVSCHLTQSVNILRIVHYNTFYIKLFCDCAPYAANYVCTSQLSLISNIVGLSIQITLYYTHFKKCGHSPADAC